MISYPGMALRSCSVYLVGLEDPEEKLSQRQRVLLETERVGDVAMFRRTATSVWAWKLTSVPVVPII